jgi:hypothetical protein
MTQVWKSDRKQTSNNRVQATAYSLRFAAASRRA